ncbi:LysM peptidoglycan-binding domain-containing protein [Bacillus fonticola]|uniref:LysM peptidoglycan-binding domain-containing protein n=1 Tax=Bacillus fonticola TaxID=2728853 RepID=UPI0014729062|nr:LysM peptidoglycan-binding domain-containing protein [Bacillus fonticola]
MSIHVVKQGESLYSISRRYDVSIDQIAAVNSLPANNLGRIVPGLALVIPLAEWAYTVQPGDSLYRIANRHGTTVARIIARNNIANPDRIQVGDSLVIPVRLYRVEAGDSLWSIAQRTDTSVDRIQALNNVQANRLQIGQRLLLPQPRKPITEVNAYSTELTEEGAQEIRELGNLLTYASPFAYVFNEQGKLNSINDEPLLRAIRETNTVPMMSITNFTASNPGTEVASTILGSPEKQQTLIQSIRDVARRKRYAGVNVDFENVAPADKENYNDFLRRLQEATANDDFFVSTAVAPKTSAEQKGVLYEAIDYPAHGEITDFVVLMTYEWGYRLGPPRAISPVDQIRRVLDYAVSVMPPEKLFLGFQIYARDWTLPFQKGDEAETFSVEEAVHRAIQYGVPIQYDEKAQSPYYRYRDEQGVEHEVWFEDARSAKAKFDLVTEYGLKGVSYWVLGYPFPENWELLDQMFRVRKK